MPVKTAEILFVKCVKNGIPNRDPLRDSDARRIFGEEDGRISLSDVSIKRDVRDYVLARFPEDGEQPDLTRLVFVQKKFGEDGKTLLGRDGLANAILQKVRAARATAEGEAPAPAKPKKKGQGRRCGCRQRPQPASGRSLRHARFRRGLQRHRKELQSDRTGPVWVGALAPSRGNSLYPGHRRDALQRRQGGRSVIFGGG